MVEGTICDELFTWPDERFNDRGSAGKARVPAKEDESAKASTTSRNEDVPIFASIAYYTSSERDDRIAIYGKFLRRRSKPQCCISARKIAKPHADHACSST